MTAYAVEGTLDVRGILNRRRARGLSYGKILELISGGNFLWSFCFFFCHVSGDEGQARRRKDFEDNQ